MGIENKYLTDRALLVRLREGDIKAFDELYYRYVHKLMAFAKTFFATKEIAEEAVQEIFIRIWEKRTTLDKDKDFKPYLYQAVKYYMYNYIRDKKHEHTFEEIPEEYFVNEDNQHDELVYRELEEKAHGLIHSLPKTQRQIFMMNKLEGMSSMEIAAKMNLSKRTVEHHIYLATKAVKGELLQNPSLLVMLFVLV